MKKHLRLLLIFSFVASFSCLAQDDLMKMAQNQARQDSLIALATFKATQLINQPTLECLGARTLDLRISHRFGQLNTGSYNAWGIDGPANLHLALDYSYDGRWMVGIGRTSDITKLDDAFLKYRLLRQTENNKMPLSVTLFTSIAYTADTISGTTPEIYNNTSDRLSYAHEIMVGRKFSSRFSLQLSGFLVHNNITQNIGDKNDVYALGSCVRYKVTKSFSLTGEYAYRLNNYTITPGSYYDSMGIGFEIETGGHVFQIFLTNSYTMNETEYIPFTTYSWGNAGIRLGFNISRVFHV